MPKKIYSNFLGGLSYYDRNAPANTYAEGREVDPQRGQGYLQPGWALGVVTKSDDIPQIITERIKDICVDYTTNDVYFIGATKLFHMTSVLSESWDDDFDGASHYYKAMTNAADGYKLIMYNISGTKYLFFAFDDSTNADSRIGTYDLSSTFDFAKITGLSRKSVDMVEWQTYLFYSHGQYVGRYDGPNDSNDATRLDLGDGWVVTKIVPTQNYLAIFAWQEHSTGSLYRSNSAIFFWDGDSTNFNYWTPLEESEIATAINHNGNIYTLSYGKDVAAVLSRLTNTGLDRITKIKYLIGGTLTSFNAPSQNGIDVFADRIFFGSTAHSVIFSYGRDINGQPLALTIPWGYTKTTSCRMDAIKTVMYNKVFISFEDTTNSKYYLLKATTGNSTRATYRGNYFDAGQKIRINYVKFYYKPLVSGDDVTPTLDINYGTSVTLRDPAGNSDITFTNDGAKNATSKRFDVKKDCHAFRPVISWTAGGVAFSKIVVDYDFIGDK